LRGRERFPEPALGCSGVALPRLDEHAIVVTERVRRTAPLHRRLGIGDPRVEIGQTPERQLSGPDLDRRAVPDELAVLQTTAWWV
jgi:hypothetical protein